VREDSDLSNAPPKAALLPFNDHHPRFFVVWGPGAGEPTKQYDTCTEARREARRLAIVNKGQKFIVLIADSSYISRDLTSTIYE